MNNSTSKKITDLSRRQFLNRSAKLAVAGTALPTALNLAAIGDAAAFNAADGSYKALVCVFLYGANDYANTVVTYDDASHAKYSAIRAGIALPKTDLAATVLTPTTALPNGRIYALNPSLAGMANLFNMGACAIQLNVGPLIEPLTRIEYTNGSKKIPPKLFSHNDQQSIWQSSESEGSTIGWGGNLGDLSFAPNGAASSFSCISVTGNSVYLAGDQAIAYQVSRDGAVKISGASSAVSRIYNSTAVRTTMETIIKQSGTHVMEKEYNKVTARSISAEISVTAALASGPGANDNTSFSALTTAAAANNSLAAQLKIVARMIAARATLGNPKRQVFMVSLGGFDLHDNLIANHPGLLKQVNDAIVGFYDATVAMGLKDQVTTFTASDFGRTLTSNGDGSDHGWGSHHFVVGGAVNGKEFYGFAPPVSVTNTSVADDQFHVGSGRLLPTTAVDQYAGTLATWFGVADSELTQVLPNINNFNNVTLGAITYKRNMGFMKPA